MPPRQREIALLRWQDQLRTAEIADRLGLAEGTVHAHLHAARRKLIAGLEPYYPSGRQPRGDQHGEGQQSGEGTGS